MKLAALNIKEFNLINFVISPYILLAIFCFGLQSFFWQLALRKHNLSYAYYFMSLRYFITVAMGYFIFSEDVNAIHLGGLFVIVIGIMIFVRKNVKYA